MAKEFDTRLTQRDTVLTASQDCLVNDALEIAAAYLLEIPATTTLEVFSPLGSVNNTSDAAKPVSTAQATAIQATIRRPLNNVVVALGVSITNWLMLDSCYLPVCNDNFTGHLCLESFQRMRFGGVMGHNATPQAVIISTYLPTILAMNPSPGACIYIDAPLIDIVNGVGLAQTKVNLQTVITALLAKNIWPILGTIGPAYAGANQAQIQQWNYYIRRLAATNGYGIIDLDVVLADVNAAFIPALNFDGVHPNTYGHQLIAQQALADGLADMFPENGTVQTSRWVGDLTNLLNNGAINIGLFTTNVSGLGTGWTLQQGSASTCTIVAPTAQDQLSGNWQQIACAAGVGETWFSLTLSTGWSPGDILAISARIQTSNIWGSQGNWSVAMVQYFSGGYNYPPPGTGSASPAGYVWAGCNGWLSDVSDGLMYVEVPMLAGTTTVFAMAQCTGGTSGTAILRLGEFTIVNLTTGSILS